MNKKVSKKRLNSTKRKYKHWNPESDNDSQNIMIIKNIKNKPVQTNSLPKYINVKETSLKIQWKINIKNKNQNKI